MMRKNKRLAAVCSLVFVMGCSACGGTGQEVLLIGQGDTGQEAVLSGQGDTRQEVLLSGREDAGQGTLLSGREDAGQGALLSARGGAGQEALLPGQNDTGQEAAQEICVYVCGAVAAPGVVFLPAGSRAADALEAAGGFGPEAAEEAVNLAARVSDGEKLYFPTREEHAVEARAAEDAASGLVNINTADAAQLCTLPGIGESRAADIIAYREAHGGFAACEEIMQVSGIKESVYNRISGKITVK